MAFWVTLNNIEFFLEYIINLLYEFYIDNSLSMIYLGDLS